MSLNEMSANNNTASAGLTLSPEQQLALDEFSKGKNIFLTGPGGSGKTELIKRMVLASEGTYKKCQVCALTGCG